MTRRTSCCHSLSFVVTGCYPLLLVVTRRITLLSFYKRSSTAVTFNDSIINWSCGKTFVWKHRHFIFLKLLKTLLENKSFFYVSLLWSTHKIQRFFFRKIKWMKPKIIIKLTVLLKGNRDCWNVQHFLFFI